MPTCTMRKWQQKNIQRYMNSNTQDKITGLREEMDTLQRRMKLEYDANEKKKLELRIKVCQLKIMIAEIE